MRKLFRTTSPKRGPGAGLWREVWPLALGLCAALAVGWLVFPHVLYSTQAQPVQFNHELHLESGGAECSSCHFLRPDGSFSGRPSVETCAECHAAPLGDSAAERRLLEEYIRPGREIPWESYAAQPAHVFFSHAAHRPERCNTCHQFTAAALCASCHADMSQSDRLPAYRENRWTGYSADILTMRRCVSCHALPGHAPTMAGNDCAVCHK